MKLGGLQACSLIDYPGHLCAIVFTVGCNFRCPYCHNPELVLGGAEELSVESFFDFLQKRIGKLDGVTITGGEPTLHPDLLDFMQRIKELGFKVKLDSNGTNPAKLKEAIEKGLVDYLAMDIKSPLVYYSRTVAMPVDTEKIRESIDLLRSGVVPYEFRTTIVKTMLTLDDFHQIGREIEGAEHYYLQKFVPTKTVDPTFLLQTTYNDEEFENIAALMRQYVKNCTIR